jgi:hypothetical protein
MANVSAAWAYMPACPAEQERLSRGGWSFSESIGEHGLPRGMHGRRTRGRDQLT